MRACSDDCQLIQENVQLRRLRMLANIEFSGPQPQTPLCLSSSRMLSSALKNIPGLPKPPSGNPSLSASQIEPEKMGDAHCSALPVERRLYIFHEGPPRGRLITMVFSWDHHQGRFVACRGEQGRMCGLKVRVLLSFSDQNASCVST